MRKLIVLSTLVSLVGIVATPAVAQVGRAELRGQVTDEQGGALPGVTVLITDQNAGTYREIITGADGSFFAAQLLPGVFTVTTALPGFSTFERTDFDIGVGRTQSIDIVMAIGGIEETITVSGVAPLVDLTSAEVGGTVTQGELVDLPTGNRSYFAAVALLPGIQFSPSSSLGNDSMIANGQPQGSNSVGFDGAANNDDASGSAAGGQVRIPLESVSEFQVLTNQFDAEFGRVSGAIVNSITKQGTNQVTGAAFNYLTSDAMTSEDFFVRNSDTLTKPETSKKEFGGVIGGPIVPDKAHFFFSLERQIVDPSRSREYAGRPDLAFTLSEKWRAWNTLMRMDHQMNGNNSWAFRWLREDAPQFNLIGNRTATEHTIQDETDNDQIWVGTYTSVIGNTMVNTARGTVTSESFNRANPCWRAAGAVFGGQNTCAPEWEHLSFTDNQLASQFSRDDENYQIGNTFSWFVPDKMGDHDFKFGGTFHRSLIRTHTETDLAGTFEFNTDRRFDASDPFTYPDRLRVRVGSPEGQTFEYIHRTWEMFFQDKWQASDRFTVGLGVRWDTELLDSRGQLVNPLIPDGRDPRDYDNVSPRTSIAYDVEGDGRSVIRAGYGVFYDKSRLDRTDDVLQLPMFADSFTQTFPNASADPGPSMGVLPTDPFLLNFASGGGTVGCPANPTGDCPTIDRAALNAMFPSGTAARNTGDVHLDSENRNQPWMHQMTLGYERELLPTLSVSADYIRTMGRDQHGRIRYNMSQRLGTDRTDDVIFNDVFDALGPDFANFENDVLVQESFGSSNYDALNIAVERRYSNQWGGRLAYALGKSRGTTFEQNTQIFTQVGPDLNLEAFRQPSTTDRRHILTLSGRTELPFGITASSVIRYMSATPFTVHDTNFDPNQNGLLLDPLAAGTYRGDGDNAISVDSDGGFHGARGPDFLQVDVRFGYRARPYQAHTLDIFFDIFNLTNRSNFNNPTGDRRSGSFLRLVTLRGGSGFPRQGQFGIRYGF